MYHGAAASKAADGSLKEGGVSDNAGRGWLLVEDDNQIGVRVDAVEAFGVDEDGAWVLAGGGRHRLGSMTFEELSDHLDVEADNAAAERARKR